MTSTDETTPASSSSSGTTSADYPASYYTSHHLGAGNYGWASDHWRNFFLNVADRVVAAINPTTSLDVGCAKGLLVQALATRGVDAFGFDVSEHAISDSHPDVRDRLWVGSATSTVERRYDMISCVEVLEHMSPPDVQQAIDAMCASSDVILFSSNPTDYAESTHINTHGTAQWAAWFAERGFFRRTDIDAEFLTPWAIVFQRQAITPRTIVERYEAYAEPLRNEVVEKRGAILDMHRRLTQVEGAREVELDDEAILSRHAELTARDNVMGLEAQVAKLTNDLKVARKRVARLRDRLEDAEGEVRAVRESRTWRAGRVVTAPLRKLR